MKYLKSFSEKIVLDIKVGDTVLGGRFKNKKTIVKKIGKNPKGDITINGKPLLRYRIVKEAKSYKKNYNKELIETLKELSLDYLDEGKTLNYWIVSEDLTTIFYNGQFSHDEFNGRKKDDFRKICDIDEPFLYLIRVGETPFDVDSTSTRELFWRLKEWFPSEKIEATFSPHFKGLSD